MNLYDTVVEVVAEIPIVAMAQHRHMIQKWEEVPVSVLYIMGKKENIMDVVHYRSETIKQRGEAERDIE